MYLGIDVSKARLDCLKVLKENQEGKHFSNTKTGIKRLLKWLDNSFEVHVVMEATGVYWQHCALAIHKQGYKVSVVNPAQVKYFAKSILRRGKTDPMDAELIALYAQKMQPEAWHPNAHEVDELKLLVRERDDLVSQLRQAKNQLHAHKHRSFCPTTILKLLKQKIKLLEKQLKILEQAIQAFCHEHFTELFRSLLSMPGVGLVTAAVLIAETAALESFNHPKQLTAFAGIAPAPNQSGSFTGRTAISKIGNPRIRQALYMAAMQARHKSVFKDLYLRLVNKGKAKKLALIAVARKLLIIAFTLAKTNSLFDPHFLHKKLAQKQNLTSIT